MGYWPGEECGGRGTHQHWIMSMLTFWKTPPKCPRCNGDMHMRSNQSRSASETVMRHSGTIEGR